LKFLCNSGTSDTKRKSHEDQPAEQDVSTSGGKWSSMQIPLPNLDGNISSPGIGIQYTLQRPMQQILQMPRPVDSCVGCRKVVQFINVD